MGLPVDTSRAIVICGQAPEAMVDRATGERRTNQDGAQMWRVWLVLLGDDEPTAMRVKTPKEPKGLVKGQPVNVSDLVASSWTTPDGKDIDLYNASSIEPASRLAKDAP
jgi:hypothetical protein